MKKILLIEDEEILIEFYEEVFKTAGFEIETIRWGTEALKRLKEIREGKKEKPDLILLDIVLEDVNGLEILKEARKYPQTKDLRIFALTAYTDPQLDKELLKEGIDKILVKTDWTPSRLIPLVKETLGLK